MGGSPAELGSATRSSGPVEDGSVTAVGGQASWRALPDRLQAGDLLAGRYQIEALIGTGASGRVLRAFDRESRSVVAVKILKPELARDVAWLDRLSRELRVGRQIQHPHVCRVFDIGEADGYRFLTMELAAGGTMATELAARTAHEAAHEAAHEVPSTVPFEARLADARAIVDGVAAFHAAGVIHRDIKPDNILRMADGRLVVSDFGLATDPGGNATSTLMVGTPAYMAPEVAFGHSSSARSDVWSLGVVLHEVLFGGRPRWEWVPGEAGSARKVCVSRVEQEGPRERAMADLCVDCVADVPEARPASAVEVLRRFEDAALGRRPRRPTRRRRHGLWAATALVCVGALWVARPTWWSRAKASLGAGTVPAATRVLSPGGTAADWSRGAELQASFPGHVACASLVDGGRKVQVIWGAPPRAEEIVLATGERTAAKLLPETFAEGCPVSSPDGRSLLFVRSRDVGTYVHTFVQLSSSPDGAGAREIVMGTRPLWLPSGDEFAFDLDSRHAGIFSLPTGEMTVVGEGISGTRQLAEKAVSPDGTLIALRYYDDAADSRIVVESLRTLEIAGSFVVPTSAMHLDFARTGGKLLFTLYDPERRAELVEADWRTGESRWLARFPGADIQALLPAPRQGWMLLARKVDFDAWLDADEAPRRLTHDGLTDGGAMNQRGDLLLQRFEGKGGFSIVLRRAGDGRETHLTEGPFDISPAFFSDSDRWVYTSYHDQRIVECRLSSGGCVPLLADASTPAWPTVDPSSRWLAYETLMNAPRLHLVDLATHENRDLGPVVNACAPVWGEAEGGDRDQAVGKARLWALRAHEPMQVWAEFDAMSGSRTGRTVTAAFEPGRPCRVPPTLRPFATKRGSRVLALADEQVQLWARTTTP
jgi:serine/threonine-protein kinase